MKHFIYALLCLLVGNSFVWGSEKEEGPFNEGGETGQLGNTSVTLVSPKPSIDETLYNISRRLDAAMSQQSNLMGNTVQEWEPNTDAAKGKLRDADIPAEVLGFTPPPSSGFKLPMSFNFIVDSEVRIYDITTQGTLTPSDPDKKIEVDLEGIIVAHFSNGGSVHIYPWDK